MVTHVDIAPTLSEILTRVMNATLSLISDWRTMNSSTESLHIVRYLTKVLQYFIAGRTDRVLRFHYQFIRHNCFYTFKGWNCCNAPASFARAISAVFKRLQHGLVTEGPRASLHFFGERWVAAQKEGSAGRSFDSVHTIWVFSFGSLHACRIYCRERNKNHKGRYDAN